MNKVGRAIREHETLLWYKITDKHSIADKETVAVLEKNTAALFLPYNTFLYHGTINQIRQVMQNE
mgnify:FL=1